MGRPIEGIVSFKSSTVFYNDEKAGLKNNTIRKIGDGDDRFRRLRRWINLGYEGNIRIIRAELPNDSFVRQIKHITIWNDYMIITWRA